MQVIHANDSQKAFGSHADRHAHIGEGEIGLEAFRLLVNDPRLAGLPIIVETPESETMHEVNVTPPARVDCGGTGMSGTAETPENGTQRVEAFSDGVFAIAITLLILEIKVPHLNETGRVSDLASALRGLWPSYFAYIFSFVMVGIYWANHHFIFKLYQKTDHAFNLLNLLFLMCISFLPFPTNVLSEYFTDTRPHNHQSAISFYILGLFLPAFSWYLVWLYGSYRYRLIDKNLEEKFVGFLTRQYTVSPLLYALSLGVSFVNPNVGLALCVGLTLLYLLPPKKPVYRPPSPQ